MVTAPNFRLRPLTLIGSPTTTRQATVGVYKQKLSAETFHITLMVQMKLVYET